MGASETGDCRPPLGSRSVEELAAHIAAPRQHVGGGSAAAASGALAAACAELVVTLSIRRSTPADAAEQLRGWQSRLKELQAELLAAGDHDEAVLAELMAAYKARATDQEQHLTAAARSVLAIAALASEVGTIAAAAVDFASRFTVSDLGAAATIARGATQAGLMTAEINIQMLAELDNAPTSEVAELREAHCTIDERSQVAADRAIAGTRARLNPGGAP